jgi:hypothetical protein
LVGVLACSSAAAQNIVEWRVENGGNGHSYQAVATPIPISWETANSAAQTAGGHLATIASPAENAFVFSLIDSPQFWHNNITNAHGPYLGGFQPEGSPEPAGNWQWVTGEPWLYTNWGPFRPDNHGDEQYLHYFSPAPGTRSPGWNDILLDDNVLGYIVEYDRVGTPTISISAILAGGETAVVEGGLAFCSDDIIHCTATTTNANGLSAIWHVDVGPGSGTPPEIASAGEGSIDFQLRGLSNWLAITPSQTGGIFESRFPAFSFAITASLVDPVTRLQVGQAAVWSMVQSDLGQLRQEYVDFKHAGGASFPPLVVPDATAFTSNYPELNTGDYLNWALVSGWSVYVGPRIIIDASMAAPPMATWITSCYRNPVHHANVYLRDGIPDLHHMYWSSRHLYGAAIDFHVGEEFETPRHVRNLRDYERLKPICEEWGLVRREPANRALPQRVDHVHVEQR